MIAGVLQPHVSRDDSILSRFTRAGFLYAREHCMNLAALPSSASNRCGVLQLAGDAAQLALGRGFRCICIGHEVAVLRNALAQEFAKARKGGSDGS